MLKEVTISRFFWRRGAGCNLSTIFVGIFLYIKNTDMVTRRIFGRISDKYSEEKIIISGLGNLKFPAHRNN
jgi:hypothetical protein